MLPAALIRGALMWLAYVALEPHLRRVWPDMMIGWSRLLLGRFRDPLVGRDVLIGVLAGVAYSALVLLRVVAPASLGLTPPTPVVVDPALSVTLLGGRFAFRFVLGPAQGNALLGAMATVLLLFVLYVLLRRRWAAAGVAVLLGLGSLAAAPRESFAVLLVLQLLSSAGAVFLLLRFGALALIVTLFVFELTRFVPLTFDSSVPYVLTSYLIAGAILALAAYGFHTALAGRPILGAGFLREEPHPGSA
jgi:serine/threonine-protein kinase